MNKMDVSKILRGKLRYLPILVIVFILALGGGAGRARDSGLVSGSEDSRGQEPGHEIIDRTDMSEAESVIESGIPVESGTGSGMDESANQDLMESEAASIYVHICGCVKNPGVYALDFGARVQEAVQAAGGFTEGADTEYWNLAEVLIDGLQVRIPSREESMQASEAMSVSDADVGIASNAGVFDAQGRVNLNLAGMTELMSLPGIGEVKAAAILAYREEHGDYLSIEDVKNVSGIGDSSFEKIRDSITVE